MPAHIEPEAPDDEVPEAVPERRSDDNGAPTTLIMQGYENMGQKGRRRLMWIGLAMVTAGVGVGLFGAALSLYRFIFVVFITLLGSGFIFPQYGIAFAEMIVPAFLAKLNPLGLLSRPDRRNNDEGDE